MDQIIERVTGLHVHRDSVWICQLVEHGLVRPLFVHRRRSANSAT